MQQLIDMYMYIACSQMPYCKSSWKHVRCRKTQSTFYNKAEVLYLIQAFTYILFRNPSQDDTTDW